jgi:hypothetical protein
MARQKVDKDTRLAIRNARAMIAEVAKADGNEAETRRRVERIFESVMGYDVFKHVSREHAVRGAGETEHCDFAIQIEEDESAKPVIMVELKRAGVDLAPKHLRQVSSYAINAGCEWIILTNGREWRLYHVAFGQPPETKLLQTWNLLQDEISVLAQRFDVLNYKNVKKGLLDKLWAKTNVLTPRNVLGAILSEESIRLLRRTLRKTTGVLVSPEDVVGGIRRVLNEVGAAEMDSMKISLPERTRRRRRSVEPSDAKGTEERGEEEAKEEKSSTADPGDTNGG